MADATGTNHLSIVQTLIEKLGFPTVVCIALGWAYYTTITWEREKMLPAIEKNTMVLEKTEHALERVLNGR